LGLAGLPVRDKPERETSNSGQAGKVQNAAGGLELTVVLAAPRKIRNSRAGGPGFR